LLKLPFASYILMKYFERKTKIEFILAQDQRFQPFNSIMTLLLFWTRVPLPNESHQLSQPSKSTCWLDTQELSAFRGLSPANAPGRHVTPPTNPLHLSPPLILSYPRTRQSTLGELSIIVFDSRQLATPKHHPSILRWHNELGNKLCRL